MVARVLSFPCLVPSQCAVQYPLPTVPSPDLLVQDKLCCAMNACGSLAETVRSRTASFE